MNSTKETKALAGMRDAVQLYLYPVLLAIVGFFLVNQFDDIERLKDDLHDAEMKITRQETELRIMKETQEQTVKELIEIQKCN